MSGGSPQDEAGRMIPQESTPFHEIPRLDDERAHRRDMVLLLAARPRRRSRLRRR